MRQPEGYIVCITVSILAAICIFASLISDQFFEFEEHSFGLRRIYSAGFRVSYESTLKNNHGKSYASESIEELIRMSAMVTIACVCLCGSIILDIVCLWLTAVQKHAKAKDCCIMASAVLKIIPIIIGTYSICEAKFVVAKILYKSRKNTWKNWPNMKIGPSSIIMAVGLSFTVLSVLIHLFLILTSASSHKVVYRQRTHVHDRSRRSRTRSFFNFFPALPPYRPPPPEYTSKPSTPVVVDIIGNHNAEVQIDGDQFPSEIQDNEPIQNETTMVPSDNTSVLSDVTTADSNGDNTTLSNENMTVVLDDVETTDNVDAARFVF